MRNTRSAIVYNQILPTDIQSDGRAIQQARDPPGQRSAYIFPGDTERETYRLSTFKKFPTDVPVHPHLFASNGFYYTGYRDRVKCFKCGQSNDNWVVGDDISLPRCHREDCQFINGSDSSNVPIASFIQNHRNGCRRSPTANQLSNGEIPGTSSSLHQANSARNNSNSTHSNLPNDMEENDTTVRNINPVNIRPRENGVEESRQSNNLLFPCLHPVNPHMRSTEARLQTFRDNANIWPAHRIRTTPQEIADAGFFYLGERDRTKCWYCNGGLQNWERDDNPWEEHAKWFPMCEFLIRKKGPEFVHGIVSRFPNLRRPTLFNPTTAVAANTLARTVQSSPRFLNGLSGLQSSQRAPVIVDPQEELHERNSKIEEEMRSSDLVAQARLICFEDRVIREALERKYEQDNQGFSSFENLVDAIIAINEDPEANDETMNVDATSTNASSGINNHSPSNELQEMRRLEEERICKVCRREVACMVFIPCGHLACCLECGSAAERCPICKARVREKVRSFLS